MTLIRLLLLFVAFSSDTTPDPTYSCGIQALYTVLHLEGSHVDLVELKSIIGGPSNDGYSMKQMRDAARVCGFRLMGVRLVAANNALDRPALVYLQSNHHGHFVVIRPVGSTGKLVQVIDSSQLSPSILDAAQLYSSPEWTGLALIPDRFADRYIKGVSFLGGFVVVFVLLFYVRKKSGRALG